MTPKKYLYAALLASFAAGTVSAVEINGRNFGQVLIAPIYYTTGGFTNTIRVVNSSQTDAVKAKLVLRSAVDGRECRSTILYLTPSDVAELAVKLHPSNPFKATLYSDDDSLLSGLVDNQPVFASQTPYQSETSTADFIRPEANGYSQNGLANGDHCDVGHVEVIGAYAVRGTINTPAGLITVREGIIKSDIHKAFSTDRATLNDLNPSNPPQSVLLKSLDNLNRIALSGSIEITDQAGGLITVPMTPLISSSEASLVAEGPAHLIGNNDFDVTASDPTPIGEGWGQDGVENLPDIEAALESQKVASSYANTPGYTATNPIITFPTKYRHLRTQSPIDYSRAFGKPSPFYSNGSVEFGTNSFDQRGNGDSIITCWGPGCPTSFSYYLTDSTSYIHSAFFSLFLNAERGWFYVEFTNPNPPVPTIAYTHRMTLTGSVVEPMAYQ